MKLVHTYIANEDDAIGRLAGENVFVNIEEHAFDPRDFSNAHRLPLSPQAQAAVFYLEDMGWRDLSRPVFVHA